MHFDRSARQCPTALLTLYISIQSIYRFSLISTACFFFCVDVTFSLLSLYLSHWFFSSFLLNFCGCSLAAEIQSLKIYSNVIQRIRGVLNTQRSFSGRTWNDFICKISEWVSEWLYNAETNATQHTPKNNLENRKHVRLRMSMTRSENIMHKYGLHTMLYESASHYEFRLKWFD